MRRIACAPRSWASPLISGNRTTWQRMPNSGLSSRECCQHANIMQGPGMPSPWERLLEQPNSGGHFVQLYKADESNLSKNVGHYVWEGLRRGDGVLLITTAGHRELFSERLESLGADLPALLAGRRLVFLNAEQTMAQFMVGGQPDWERFERVIRAAVRE